MLAKKSAILIFAMVFMSIIVYADEWVNIKGTVQYEEQPLCAMVLANGQHKFTCEGDGGYELNVPLNTDGKITLYTFCEGFAPFNAVLEPLEAEYYEVNMSPASESFPDIILTSSWTQVQSGWVTLTGAVSYKGTPLCAMVLANGQHMFSCTGDGKYSLEVPLNEDGKVTLYGFCEGFLPYKMVLPIIPEDDDTVVFPDENFEAEIREAIEKPEGDILISDLQGITSLDASLTEIENIEGIQFCSNLTELKLGLASEEPCDFCCPIPDLKLGIESEGIPTQLSDITPLANLTNLTELHLFFNQISDIGPLADLTNLTKLYLDSNQIGDISPLENLTNLTELDLNTNQISDISPIVSLTDLAKLNISFNQISDISPLENLTKLTGLGLASNEISDLSPLVSLTDLKEIYLGSNEINDINPLADLTELTAIYLGTNKLSDISPLASLTDLTKLNLYSNQISDISPLENLTYLTELNLNENQVSDISPLENLSDIKLLGLLLNQVSDISPLENLTNLTNIALISNKITDIKPLVDNNGINSGDIVYLFDNPLNTISCTVYIPELQDRGVLVHSFFGCP
ncbi:MAG: leucine-rich repeat domain-containing protein [Desulfobacterales bacterium]|nr:leucine-rich repeat domain-containing protein [Desulfobacterales bacterium]